MYTHVYIYIYIWSQGEPLVNHYLSHAGFSSSVANSLASSISCMRQVLL